MKSRRDYARETAVKMLFRCHRTPQECYFRGYKEGIRKALGRDEEFARKFTEKVNIPIFSIDELVEFAKILCTGVRVRN